MRTATHAARSLRRDERGASAIEYTLLAALMAVVAVAFGDYVVVAMSHIHTEMATAVDTAGG